MFKFLKKNKEIINTPIEGRTIAISKVKDPTFAQELIGKGVAIVPREGKVVAPIDGRVELVFDTKHALTMKSDDGLELLIHVGIDTVTLKGKHFEAFVETGQEVKAGQLLLKFDMDGIQKDGFDITSPVVICNPFRYKKIVPHIGKQVKFQDEILTVIK